jgi:hypothetical protein
LNPTTSFTRLRFFAASVLAVALLSATGCSEGGADVSVSSTDEPFSESELAAMRKSVKTQSEFRELKKLKLAERAGAAVVKIKLGRSKSK